MYKTWTTLMLHISCLNLVKTIRMSSKLVVFCLAFAAVSSVPLNNNGYFYTEGVSGSLDTSASGVNFVQQPSNYVQNVQPHVTTVTTGTKYVQPQVTTVTTGTKYVQPQVTTVTTGTNYVQPQVTTVTTGSKYVQPQVNFVQTSGPQVVGQASRTHYVQPQVNYVQNSGSRVVGQASTTRYVQPQANYAQASGEIPSILISASSVGVPYERSTGNQVVEQNYNQELQYSNPIISKSFYTFSGPEEHDEKTAVHHINIGRPQKNYRVIFIKNPSSSINKALIKAHVAPTEEKTVVYVLSKHQNELNVESEIDEPEPTQPSKPEVVFVKYRNPEEIRHLQETVQTQYNVLGGVNQVSDEGFAPVRSVVGILDGGDHSLESNINSVGVSGGSTYTTGSVGLGGRNVYTSASENSNVYTNGNSNTYTTSGSSGLISGNVGVKSVQFIDNGASASTPQFVTSSTEEKTYLPPSIRARSITITDEDQGREISRVIKSTAKLQAIASVENEKEEEEKEAVVEKHE